MMNRKPMEVANVTGPTTTVEQYPGQTLSPQVQAIRNSRQYARKPMYADSASVPGIRKPGIEARDTALMARPGGATPGMPMRTKPAPVMRRK